jgi:hypothetical protein
MKLFKQILGVLFAVLFTLTAVPALIFFNFDRRVFTAETYKSAFTEADFYNKVPIIMAQNISSSGSAASQDTAALSSSTDQITLENFFRTLLSPEDLKTIGDGLLDSTFAYLNMQSNTVQYPTVPIKTRMNSDAGVQAFLVIYNTLPRCTAEQMGQMALDALSNNRSLSCRPPERFNTLLIPMIQDLMKSASLELPDQIIVHSNTASPENDWRVKLRSARIAMRFSPILPLLFLLLMTVFTVNSLKSWLKWWGVPLFITGLFTSLAGLGGMPIFEAFFKNFFVNELPGYVQGWVNELISIISRDLFNPILWQGLAITFIGLAMIIGSYLVSRRQKPITNTPDPTSLTL